MPACMHVCEIHIFFSLMIHRTFLHELEACVKDPNEMAKVFLRHVSLHLYTSKFMSKGFKCLSTLG